MGAALLAAGVPFGAPRPPPTHLDFDVLRASLAELPLDALDAREAECLFAWLEAWQARWPSSYSRELGAIGERVRVQLGTRSHDPDRYLKLRRIAIANLAGAL